MGKKNSQQSQVFIFTFFNRRKWASVVFPIQNENNNEPHALKHAKA